MNILWVCSMARLRSKTGYTIFGGDYCGTDYDADKPVTKSLMDWADIIICMETRHRSKLRRKYKGYSNKIKVLNIPDEYEFMDDILCNKLKVAYQRIIFGE